MLIRARKTCQQPASAVQISPNIIAYQTNVYKRTSDELPLTSEDFARIVVHLIYSPKSITSEAFIQVKPERNIVFFFSLSLSCKDLKQRGDANSSAFNFDKLKFNFLDANGKRKVLENIQFQ